VDHSCTQTSGEASIVNDDPKLLLMHGGQPNGNDDRVLHVPKMMQMHSGQPSVLSPPPGLSDAVTSANDVMTGSYQLLGGASAFRLQVADGDDQSDDSYLVLSDAADDGGVGRLKEAIEDLTDEVKEWIPGDETLCGEDKHRAFKDDRNLDKRNTKQPTAASQARDGVDYNGYDDEWTKNLAIRTSGRETRSYPHLN
jgi:hypothetical protein